MTIVAILFLVLCGMRVLLWWFDDGFGGPIWDTILWVSSVAWVLAGMMALSLLGLLPKMVWCG